ncbi:unnamed protein product [Boreogadus saida]
MTCQLKTGGCPERWPSAVYPADLHIGFQWDSTLAFDLHPNTRHQSIHRENICQTGHSEDTTLTLDNFKTKQK